MPYSIAWNDDRTVVHQIYEGEISRGDFESMVFDSRGMLDSVLHPVDLMIEWRGERHVMQDLSMLYGAMFAERRVPPNQRFVFAINTPPAFRVIAQALKRAAPRTMGQLYFAQTVEQAYQLRTFLLEEQAKPS